MQKKIILSVITLVLSIFLVGTTAVWASDEAPKSAETSLFDTENADATHGEALGDKADASSDNKEVAETDEAVKNSEDVADSTDADTEEVAE